jgi:hypothetical protein
MPLPQTSKTYFNMFWMMNKKAAKSKGCPIKDI